jgi:hypothetical protein
VSDITERLRAQRMQQQWRSPGDRTTRVVTIPDPLCQGAADEIDRLRAELAEAVEREREACAKVCDVTPPHPFRPSIEAAHAIRARSQEKS